MFREVAFPRQGTMIDVFSVWTSRPNRQLRPPRLGAAQLIELVLQLCKG
jgi:hypothetical protein